MCDKYTNGEVNLTATEAQLIGYLTNVKNNASSIRRVTLKPLWNIVKF